MISFCFSKKSENSAVESATRSCIFSARFKILKRNGESLVARQVCRRFSISDFANSRRSPASFVRLNPEIMKSSRILPPAASSSRR